MQEETDEKNLAYFFIIEHGLMDAFREFRKGYLMCDRHRGRTASPRTKATERRTL